MPKYDVSDENDSWLRGLRPQALKLLNAGWNDQVGPDQVLTLIRQGKIVITPETQIDSPKATINVWDLDPFKPGDLTHTRVVNARVGGKAVTPNQWQAIVQEVHRVAFDQLKSVDALKQASLANITDTMITSGGYKPISDLGFSIQNTSANDAWNIIIHLARQFNIPIEVEFDWYPKAAAAHPGERGRLVWQP